MKVPLFYAARGACFTQRGPLGDLLGDLFCENSSKNGRFWQSQCKLATIFLFSTLSNHWVGLKGHKNPISGDSLFCELGQFIWHFGPKTSPTVNFEPTNEPPNFESPQMRALCIVEMINWVRGVVRVNRKKRHRSRFDFC